MFFFTDYNTTPTKLFCFVLCCWLGCGYFKPYIGQIVGTLQSYCSHIWATSKPHLITHYSRISITCEPHYHNSVTAWPYLSQILVTLEPGFSHKNIYKQIYMHDCEHVYKQIYILLITNMFA